MLMQRTCPTECIPNICVDCFSIMPWPLATMRLTGTPSRGATYGCHLRGEHAQRSRRTLGSVYKIQQLTDADVTFVLTNGGHNAGIVNPPGRPHSTHQIATHREQEKYVDPDTWQKG